MSALFCSKRTPAAQSGAARLDRPNSVTQPALPDPPELSLVVPVFNEGETIDLLAQRVRPVLERCAESFEVVFVDDGSADDTLARIRALNATDPRFRAVSFSRNFGKEIAIAAGLDHARGKAVVIMDADLQHPPEMIETFVRHWREGYLMVYGQRTDREADGPLRRGFTRAFYRLFQAFGETPLPEGAGDFRLLDRRAVEALRQMGERARFSKGLYAWIGFRQIGVPFEVAQRSHGSSKFNARKLFRFAFDGITSFSTVPLRLWTYIGVCISAIAFMLTLFFVAETIIRGVDVPGFASLIVVGDVLLRRAADLARRHRRICRPHLRRGETPAPLHRRRQRRPRSRPRRPLPPRRAGQAPRVKPRLAPRPRPLPPSTPLILRSGRSPRLEGRTLPLQPVRRMEGTGRLDILRLLLDPLPLHAFGAPAGDDGGGVRASSPGRRRRGKGIQGPTHHETARRDARGVIAVAPC